MDREAVMTLTNIQRLERKSTGYDPRPDHSLCSRCGGRGLVQVEHHLEICPKCAARPRKKR